jgi:hypothetical protein
MADVPQGAKWSVRQTILKPTEGLLALPATLVVAALGKRPTNAAIDYKKGLATQGQRHIVMPKGQCVQEEGCPLSTKQGYVLVHDPAARAHEFRLRPLTELYQREVPKLDFVKPGKA